MRPSPYQRVLCYQDKFYMLPNYEPHPHIIHWFYCGISSAWSCMKLLLLFWTCCLPKYNILKWNCRNNRFWRHDYATKDHSYGSDWKSCPTGRKNSPQQANIAMRWSCGFTTISQWQITSHWSWSWLRRYDREPHDGQAERLLVQSRG